MSQEDLRVAITGASRGLGLEFVRQYLDAGHQVFALARNPETPALMELGGTFGDRLQCVRCDVSDARSVTGARTSIGQRTNALDVLINNAGIAGDTSSGLGGFDYDELTRGFATNTLGPLRVSEACLDLLRRGSDPRIVHITSRMGSIADNDSGGCWSYRMSKAALNMASKNMSLALADAGITVMVLHPGWVRTDMGGASATLGIEESVRGMVALIDQLDLASTGGFRDYSGEGIPW